MDTDITASGMVSRRQVVVVVDMGVWVRLVHRSDARLHIIPRKNYSSIYVNIPYT